PLNPTRFVSQSKHVPNGCITALTDPAAALNAPSSATRAAGDPYVGTMNNPSGLMVFVGAPRKPSSRKLQFSPDAMMSGPTGVGVGVGDPEPLGALGDDPPQPGAAIAARSAITNDLPRGIDTSAKRVARATVVSLQRQSLAAKPAQQKGCVLRLARRSRR